MDTGVKKDLLYKGVRPELPQSRLELRRRNELKPDFALLSGSAFGRGGELARALHVEPVMPPSDWFLDF